MLKSLGALLLPAMAAAAAIEPRQLGSSLKLAGTVKLEPQVKQNAVRVLQKFGPISLSGVSQSDMVKTAFTDVV
jgi:hypothetical protein